MDNTAIKNAMTIRLDNVLPEYPKFVEGIRRAPDRGFRLTKAQAETAVVSGEKEKALEYWRQAEKLANEPPQEGSEPRDEKELKLLKKKIAQKKYFAE